MPAETEDLIRWYEKHSIALARIQPLIRKALGQLPEIHRLAEKGSIGEARKCVVQVEQKIWKALGVLIDPDVPGVDAADLAIRTFTSKSVSTGPNAKTPSRLKVHVAPATQERGVIRKKIEAYSDQLQLAKAGGIPTAEVVAKLAEKGWNEDRLAAAYASYLDRVFDPERPGTISQRREALKAVGELVARIEPKTIIEVDNLGAMDDKELDRMYQGLTQAMLREALGEDGEAAL